jgi:hypothetical protein
MTLEEEVKVLREKVELLEESNRLLREKIQTHRCIINTWDPAEHDREMAAIQRRPKGS